MWRVGRLPSAMRKQQMSCAPCRGSFAALPSKRYAYLLGQYLGDGSISRHRGDVFRLRIITDARYPGIIEECAEAMTAVMPTSKVNIAPAYESAAMIVSCYSKHWPCLFPQHGPGRKHARPIVLSPWQESIVQHHPEYFLRGLVHSDGCRVTNRIHKREYEYARYQFSNASKDITQMFVDACDQLGIAWRRMNRMNISVARREAVAMMDTFVGPKS